MTRRKFTTIAALTASCALAGPVGFRLPASTFSPASIPGLQLWLDASKIVGLNDGDAVGTWVDSSGNSRNYTQATGSKQPIYKTNIRGSLPVVRFDGVDDVLAATYSITCKTIVVVFDIQGALPLYATVVGIGIAPGVLIYQGATSNVVSTYNLGFGPTTSSAGSGFLVASYTFDNVTSNLRVDGTTASPVAGAFTTSFTRGEVGYLTGVGVQYFGGDVAHVLLYDTVLSPANLLELEKYFSNH